MILTKEDWFSLQHIGTVQYFKIKVWNILNVHYILGYTGSHTTKLYARIYTLYIITAMLGGFLVE
jgi:hypothetical protein